MDLKRNILASGRSNKTNGTDLRPLFEKYNYFSPGMSTSLFLLVHGPTVEPGSRLQRIDANR